MHALIEQAMVANISIGIWQGYRLDKDATRRVTEEAGASADAARVNKHLIPKEALKEIVTAQGAIRAHFYAKSLPWRDNGDRLLPRKMFTSFIEEHEKLKTAFNDEVSKFLDDKYPAAIAQAEFRMGAMFDRADYPTVSQLRHRFYADLDFAPVTSSGDFRVEIDSAYVDKVKAAMDKAAEERIAAATGDIWRRMAETVGYFQERMANPTAVFRDSTITNIGEMLDLIPGLNVLDDPKIEQVRAMIAKSFGNLDAKDIRKDPAHREALAGEAKQIVATMAGFMKAFGAGNA